MEKTKSVITILVLIAASSLTARTIKVPTEAGSIQEGINQAVHGDTVLVDEGTYYENIHFRGKNIVVASHYILTLNLSIIRATIINGSRPSHKDSASCARIVSHEDSTAVLAGFTLTGGNGTLWRDKHNSNLYREGGGVLTETSSPTIRNNVIIYNKATDCTGGRSAGGAAIRCDDGMPHILNNVIAFNQAHYGAGITLNYTGAIIRNNIILKNSGGADFGGSGIWVYQRKNGVPVLIENNTIVENSSQGGGSYGGRGGALVLWSTTATVRNNIIYGNTQSIGGAVASTGATAELSYNNIQGGAQGTGNIDAQPEFDDQFILTAGSPGIDAGNPDALYNDPEDPANTGNASLPSKGGIRNDMGAYGGPLRDLKMAPTTSAIRVNDNPLPSAFELYAVYPNPLNSSALVGYKLDSPAVVRLAIYDTIGREVRILQDGYSLPGSHAINWDGKDAHGMDLPSGAYLVCLSCQEGIVTQKALLIR
jgi:hypothetical protein